jgi:hypothetical protein
MWREFICRLVRKKDRDYCFSKAGQFAMVLRAARTFPLLPQSDPIQEHFPGGEDFLKEPTHSSRISLWREQTV